MELPQEARLDGAGKANLPPDDRGAYYPSYATILTDGCAEDAKSIICFQCAVTFTLF